MKRKFGQAPCPTNNCPGSDCCENGDECCEIARIEHPLASVAITFAKAATNHE